MSNGAVATTSSNPSVAEEIHDALQRLAEQRKHIIAHVQAALDNMVSVQSAASRQPPPPRHSSGAGSSQHVDHVNNDPFASVDPIHTGILRSDDPDHFSSNGTQATKRDSSGSLSRSQNSSSGGRAAGHRKSESGGGHRNKTRVDSIVIGAGVAAASGGSGGGVTVVPTSDDQTTPDSAVSIGVPPLAFAVMEITPVLSVQTTEYLEEQASRQRESNDTAAAAKGSAQASSSRPQSGAGSRPASAAASHASHLHVSVEPTLSRLDSRRGQVLGVMMMPSVVTAGATVDDDQDDVGDEGEPVEIICNADDPPAFPLSEVHAKTSDELSAAASDAVESGGGDRNPRDDESDLWKDASFLRAPSIPALVVMAQELQAREVLESEYLRNLRLLTTLSSVCSATVDSCVLRGYQYAAAGPSHTASQPIPNFTAAAREAAACGTTASTASLGASPIHHTRARVALLQLQDKLEEVALEERKQRAAIEADTASILKSLHDADLWFVARIALPEAELRTSLVASYSRILATITAPLRDTRRQGSGKCLAALLSPTKVVVNVEEIGSPEADPAVETIIVTSINSAARVDAADTTEEINGNQEAINDIEGGADDDKNVGGSPTASHVDPFQRRREQLIEKEQSSRDRIEASGLGLVHTVLTEASRRNSIETEERRHLRDVCLRDVILSAARHLDQLRDAVESTSTLGPPQQLQPQLGGGGSCASTAAMGVAEGDDGEVVVFTDGAFQQRMHVFHSASSMAWFLCRLKRNTLRVFHPFHDRDGPCAASISGCGPSYPSAVSLASIALERLLGLFPPIVDHIIQQHADSSCEATEHLLLSQQSSTTASPTRDRGSPSSSHSSPRRPLSGAASSTTAAAGLPASPQVLPPAISPFIRAPRRATIVERVRRFDTIRQRMASARAVHESSRFMTRLNGGGDATADKNGVMTPHPPVAVANSSGV